MGIIDWFIRPDPVLIAVNQLAKDVAMNQTELKEALDALTAQTDKVRAEVLAAIAALEAAVAAGNTSPEVDAALASLRAAVQGVDDINPDAPTP